jgi:hypothetical protein
MRKPLIVATTAALVAMATVSTKAEAGDPVLGALVGGLFGAAVGHSVNHHNGAAVGGAIGAIAGAGIAASSDGYYYGGSGYYGPGYAPQYAPVPAPVYGYGYAAPVYPAATIVYRSGPTYRNHRGHRHGHGHGHRTGYYR